MRAFAGLAGESQARNPKSDVKASQSPLNRHAAMVSASSFCRNVAFSDTRARSTWPTLIAKTKAIRGAVQSARRTHPILMMMC